MTLNPDAIQQDLAEIDGVLETKAHTSPSAWVEVAFERHARDDIERVADRFGGTFRALGCQGSELKVGTIRVMAK